MEEEFSSRLNLLLYKSVGNNKCLLQASCLSLGRICFSVWLLSACMSFLSCGKKRSVRSVLGVVGCLMDIRIAFHVLCFRFESMWVWRLCCMFCALLTPCEEVPCHALSFCVLYFSAIFFICVCLSGLHGLASSIMWVCSFLKSVLSCHICIGL